MITTNLTSAIFSLIFIITMPIGSVAQVMDDFENDETNGWYSEGDGSSSVDTNFGNPGSSFRIDDNATGSINYAIAPIKYLGNWSGATPSDSLTMDLYVQSGISTPVNGDFPNFEIVGPGGRAIGLDGVNFPPGSWHHVGVSLDTSDWELVAGNWDSLLQNVQLLRVRAEHIQGSEKVFIDNFKLSLSPFRPSISGNLCTDFESGTAEGWNFEDISGFSIDTMSGNPGYGVALGDKSGVNSNAVAPPMFLGDWSTLTDSSKISFDLNIANSSGSTFSKSYMIRLTGENSVAESLPADSIIEKAIGEWYTFTFPIDSTNWTMQSGSWSELMNNVLEIRLEMEFIDGSEDVLFDNFCIYADTSSVPTSVPIVKNNINVRIYPNPAKDAIHVDLPKAIEVNQVQVMDLQGRVRETMVVESTSGFMVSNSVLENGVYLLQLRTNTGQVITKRIVIAK